MIGVYLGFALNNYGEKRKVRKQAATFKTMLINEIQENLEQVESVNLYHDTLTDRVSMMLNSENLMTDFKKFRFTGLRPGIVNSSAYTTGVQTGILQEFDIQLIQSLNRLYAYQNNYDDYNSTMISSFLAKDFPDEEEEVRSLFTIINMNMSDVNNFERELAYSYKEILEKLGN